MPTNCRGICICLPAIALFLTVSSPLYSWTQYLIFCWNVTSHLYLPALSQCAGYHQFTLILHPEGPGQPGEWQHFLSWHKIQSWASAHLSSRTNEAWLLTDGLSVLHISTSLHHLASPPIHLQSPVAFHCSPKPSCRFPVFPQRYSYPFTLFFYSAAHSSVSKKTSPNLVVSQVPEIGPVRYMLAKRSSRAQPNLTFLPLRSRFNDNKKGYNKSGYV